MSKKYALVAAGELLADFIGTDIQDSLKQTSHFQRFQGGSPANLAANMARLGAKVALVSSVGNDNLGNYLIEEIAKTGIETKYVVKNQHSPSTIVLVARSTGTPDFIAYRAADTMLEELHFPDELLAETGIFHTTCFALSRKPAQDSLVWAAKKAAKLGATLSIDANYAPSIWPDRAQAWKVIKDYIANGALVKLSEDDAERLYGKKVNPDEVIAELHDAGAKLVCFTLGAKGAIVSEDFGKNSFDLAAQKIQVKDSTGAGDAFWSGFLTAYHDGHSIRQCAQAASKMAVLKLSTLGPLPAHVDKQLIYE